MKHQKELQDLVNKIYRLGAGMMLLFALAELLSPDAPALAESSSKAASAGKADAGRGRLQQTKSPKKVLLLPVVPQDALESIVVVVDGEPITMSDFRTFVLGRRESIGANLDPQEMEKILRRGSPEGKAALEAFAQDRMLAKEAQASGIAATAEEINLYISEVCKQNQVDLRSFEEILRSRGISLEKYREQVKDEIVRTRLISSKVRNKINVIDDDLLKSVKQEKSGSSERGKLHLEQILIRAESEAPEAEKMAREKAEDFRADADEESSLKTIDEETYSDLGFVRPSDLRPELEKEVRKLGVGKVTPVVCYEAVCAFVRRVSDTEVVEEAESNPLSGMSDSDKEALRKQIFEEKFQEALDRYLKVELPEKYQVELKW